MIKKVLFACLSAVLFFGMVSCVSLQDRNLSPLEREDANIVGSVMATYTSFQFFHIQARNTLRNKSYNELKKAAQGRYPGNTDIVNIRTSGGFSGFQIPLIIYPFASILGNFQKITATGDVLLRDGETGTAPSLRNRVRRLLPEINNPAASGRGMLFSKGGCTQGFNTL
jgi:hypothetical protein